MADIDIRIDDEPLRRDLERLSGAVDQGARKALLRAGFILDRQIATAHLTGGTTATRLRVRSGRLRGSIAKQIRDDADGPTLVVGTDVVYGRTHEEGGTITAKPGRFLTIPLPAAEYPSGVARFTARELKNSPASVGYTGSFIAKGVIFGKLGATKTGRQRTTTKGTFFGSKAEIVPLFVLKRQVKVPARPFLSSSLSEKTEDIEAAFVSEIGSAVG